jgi:hypothetical protein
MPTFNVAHLSEPDTEGGVINIIIVPLAKSFGKKTKEEQHELIVVLQLKASSAGLVGKVVPVWEDDSGGMYYIAPPTWHSYFEKLSMDSVDVLINKTLSW